MTKLFFFFVLGNLLLVGSSFAVPERLSCSLLAGGERKGSVILHLDEMGAVTSADLKVSTSRGLVRTSFDSDNRRSNSYGRIATRGSETQSTHEVNFSSNLNASRDVIGFRLRAPVWSTKEQEPGFFEEFFGTTERRSLGQLDFNTGGTSYRYGITCLPASGRKSVAVNESARSQRKVSEETRRVSRGASARGQ